MNFLPGLSNNLNELQAQAEKFPYFGLLHLNLLEKIDQSSERYSSIAQKTALHLNNPYRLHSLIAEEDALDKLVLSSAVNTTNDTIQIQSEASAPPIIEKETPKPDSSTANEMLFEPLHATDYFASQGIKLSEELIENDKLGKQLKSFTAWLKTMKKVNIEKLAEQSQPMDHKVEQMAEKSNLTEDVLTESMAEVYLNQGKTQKAIDTYQKLSLQNPSKSAYFADLIQKIKEK